MQSIDIKVDLNVYDTLHSIICYSYTWIELSMLIEVIKTALLFNASKTEST